MTEQEDKSTEKPESEETGESVLDAVKAAAAEFSEEEPKVEEQTGEAPAEVEPPAETPADLVERPEWWSAERGGVWDSLSREAQETLLTHEKERTEAIEKDRLPEPVRGALKQIEDHAQMYGLTADQALGRLYQAQRLLESNPRHALAQLAQQYGVDLSQFAAPPDGEGEVSQADDPLDAVRSVVQQELGQFEQRQTAQQTQTALQELQEWASETDKDGSPLRPHFEELQHLVKPEMDRLLTQNPAKNRWDVLGEAYNNVAVTRSQPNVDELVKQRVEEALKAQQETAQKARKAAVSPSAGASGTTAPANGSAGSVLDDVRAAAAELGDSARI